MDPVPSLGTLMKSYFRVKVITTATSFISNLDLMLLLVMLVASNLNCENYEEWFQQICAPIYLAYQVVVPLFLGFVTDLTQNYSLPIMRLCSIIMILLDLMLYFLPYYFPNIFVFQIPTYVLVCFLVRQGAIFQVGNCLGKILKMKLDKDSVSEEIQIAVFNHVGIFCDGLSRVLLIIVFLVIWICISVLNLNIGFDWMKSILFIASFLMDVLTIAFCFSIPEDYFMPSDKTIQVAFLKEDIQSSNFETIQAENQSIKNGTLSQEHLQLPTNHLLSESSILSASSSLINDPSISSTQHKAAKSPSFFLYFKEAAIVIWTHEGGLLRDINLHLILSIAAFSFVNLILQFNVEVPNHGTDFRNGFCGGQLMGMILLNIMKNSIMIFGAILYQTVFVKMRPFYFFRFIYVMISFLVIFSLAFKYFNIPPALTSFLFSVTALSAYWSEAYDTFLAFAITPADYVGIVGVLPLVGTSLMGILIIGYSVLKLADWITISVLIGITFIVALFTFGISFFHREALVRLDNEDEIKEKPETRSLYTKYILGYY